MSDAASVSAISVSTMDVSEAQAQPVLKPQLVTVEKAPSVPDEHQLPSRVAAASGSLSQSPPRTADPVTSSQPPVDSDLTVEPLFSKRKSIAAAPPVPVMPSAPAANDKWAKKPATTINCVIYSFTGNKFKIPPNKSVLNAVPFFAPPYPTPELVHPGTKAHTLLPSPSLMKFPPTSTSPACCTYAAKSNGARATSSTRFSAGGLYSPAGCRKSSET
ncbi:hypothetical protein COL940_010043 [Colletotrichum noveboracense]|nr:hypothetical protein COL940_010043 [Colletotrichum noveboracense]